MNHTVTPVTDTKKKQLNIFGIIKSLSSLARTVVMCKERGDLSKIAVKHDQSYVPDFELEWCSTKNHYRVYILQANTNEPKYRRGFSIAVISGPLAAVEFVAMYKFLHKHRANNKTPVTDQ